MTESVPLAYAPEQWHDLYVALAGARAGLECLNAWCYWWRFCDARAPAIDDRYDPPRHSGDVGTTCDVADGPTRDLNVMTRRDSVRADVEVKDVAAPETARVST